MTRGELTEDGQIVRRAGAKTGPAVDDRRGGERRKKLGCLGAEGCDSGGVGRGVEAGVFDGGSDEEAAGIGAGGARDDVNFGRAEDEVEGEGGRRLDVEHLALAGDDGGDRPCAGAVYKLVGVDGAGGCADGDGFGLAGIGFDVEAGVVGVEGDVGGSADGCEECAGELDGVEAVLGEGEKTVGAGDEGWAEGGEFGRGEGGLRGVVVRGERLERAAGLEGDGDAGEDFEAMQEGGVEPKAEAGERSEGGRVFGVGSGEHAGGRGGCLGEGLTGVQQDDAAAARCQLQCQGEADDAGTGDAGVTGRFIGKI